MTLEEKIEKLKKKISLREKTVSDIQNEMNILREKWQQKQQKLSEAQIDLIRMKAKLEGFEESIE